MKPLTDGSTCRRSHSRVAAILILLVFLPCFSLTLFTLPSCKADDQTSKAVRRSSSESAASIKDQKRVALVIGNSDYKDMPLRNPANDADDIAKVLRELGFTVQTKMNANHREMEDAVREFVREIQDGDVGLFYFSGHGVQVSGENYLIPVAGLIETETDCRYKAVNAGLILGKMEESRNRTNIFILDACRNNPFKGFRSMTKGLTMMDAPVGTFIAYATAPGSVAAEGTDRNSPYAKHLMQAMKSKDIKIEDVFKEVLREVRKETEGKQVPWIASSLQEDFYFNPSPVRPQVASLPPSTSSETVSVRSAEYREKAERLWVQLATHGDAATREELYRMYKDPEAVKWFRQAAEQGDAVAQLCLGRMFAQGLEVPKDEREAVKWYRKAADQGNANAQTNLGLMYERGSGVAKDYEEALKWYKKAIEQGNATGQWRLGDMYRDGRGVAKNYHEALKWYRKSAEQGNTTAQANVGWMYANGFGVPKDYDEALKWYKKAIEQGNSTGQWRLGDMYRDGRGVAKNYDEAVMWYKKAIEQGNATAQAKLGLLYAKGLGVAKDYSEAVKWYRKAAEQGNAFGEYNLGLMYKNGNGVAKDRAGARKWFTKAADQGNEYAKKELSKMGATSSR